MRLVLTETATFPARADRTWALLTDIEAMPSFRGWGPIPGIERAEWLQGEGGPGSIRRVHNLDGTSHSEELAAVIPRERLRDRIFDIASPAARLVRSMTDEWELREVADTTRLTRTFEIELRSGLLLPLGLFMRWAMRRAFRRHHAELARRLGAEGTDAA